MHLIKWEDLEKHFKLPKREKHFYGLNPKLSRKLKKKVKNFSGGNWKILTRGQLLWCYMGNINPDYRNFILKDILKKSRINIKMAKSNSKKSNWIPLKDFKSPKLDPDKIKGKNVTDKEHREASERKSALKRLIE